MATNPLGAVQTGDFGLPKVITCTAREVISGGQFVIGSAATGLISSGTSSFTSSDLTVYVGGSGAAFTGIALANAASGALVSVAIEGIFILPCQEITSGGMPISAAGGDSVGWGAIAGQSIGRCLVPGPSGGFCVAHVRA